MKQAKAKVTKGSTRRNPTKRGGKGKTSQVGRQGKSTSTVPILETEKDGRLYAMAMLEALDEAGDENTGAEAEGESTDRASDPGKLIMNIYRTAPQATPVRKWIEDLYQYGTPDAIAGFYVVVSYYFGILTHGTPSEDYFRKLEEEGKWPPAGSVIYRDQKAAEAAIAAGKDQYEITLSPEEVAQRAERGRQRQEAAPARKALSEAAQKAVEDLTSGTCMQFHALIDIAKLCGKSQISVFTVREAVTSLANDLDGPIADFRTKLGSKYPEAKGEVKRALAALDGLRLFVEQMDCSGNNEQTSVWHGRLVHAFTLDAARAVERAQEAIGPVGVGVGWQEPSQEWGMRFG